MLFCQSRSNNEKFNRLFYRNVARWPHVPGQISFSNYRPYRRIAVAKLAQSFGDRRETECLRGDRYFLTTPQIEKLISPASRTGPVTIDQC
jgi:hypothetical protein